MSENGRLRLFLDAQAPIYEQTLVMLGEGLMCSPYMDFIFPTLAGGSGGPDEPFALRSLAETRAYLDCPTLAKRYRECVAALSWLWRGAALDVFGEQDACRLMASLTLFAAASDDELIGSKLDFWFDGRVAEDIVARLAVAS